MTSTTSSPAPSDITATSDAASRYPVEEHRLDNGLRLVLHRDSRLPLVAVNLWYHVGSKDERPGLTGFAHLFEHMLFQGSENVQDTDHFRYLQQVGGVANGSTWYDRTNYFETLPSHHLDLGLWLESDRMGFMLPALTSAKLENQRAVVMNERRERVDNQPYGRAVERLNELLYPEDHPYHWPVIGYMDDIAAATLDDVREFFRTHYTPNNAVLTLAGDLPDDARERVERWFGPIPSGPEPTAPSPPDPTFTGVRREEIAADVRLPRLYMGFVGPRYGTREWYAADLLGTLLSSGKKSVFYEDLVYHRELARSLSAYTIPTELAASFLVSATVTPDAAPEELERSVSEHLDRIAADGPPEDALERAKNRVMTDLEVEFQTLAGRADLLSQSATLLGDPRLAFTEGERYREVTVDDVAAVAAGHFAADAGRAVVTVRPRDTASAEAAP
jgi:zinc protease